MSTTENEDLDKSDAGADIPEKAVAARDEAEDIVKKTERGNLEEDKYVQGKSVQEESKDGISNQGEVAKGESLGKEMETTSGKETTESEDQPGKEKSIQQVQPVRKGGRIKVTAENNDKVDNDNNPDLENVAQQYLEESEENDPTEKSSEDHEEKVLVEQQKPLKKVEKQSEKKKPEKETTEENMNDNSVEHKEKLEQQKTPETSVEPLEKKLLELDATDKNKQDTDDKPAHQEKPVQLGEVQREKKKPETETTAKEGPSTDNNLEHEKAEKEKPKKKSKSSSPSADAVDGTSLHVDKEVAAKDTSSTTADDSGTASTTEDTETSREETTKSEEDGEEGSNEESKSSSTTSSSKENDDKSAKKKSKKKKSKKKKTNDEDHSERSGSSYYGYDSDSSLSSSGSELSLLAENVRSKKVRKNMAKEASRSSLLDTIAMPRGSLRQRSSMFNSDDEDDSTNNDDDEDLEFIMDLTVLTASSSQSHISYNNSQHQRIPSSKPLPRRVKSVGDSDINISNLKLYQQDKDRAKSKEKSKEKEKEKSKDKEKEKNKDKEKDKKEKRKKDKEKQADGDVAAWWESGDITVDALDNSSNSHNKPKKSAKKEKKDKQRESLLGSDNVNSVDVGEADLMDNSNDHKPKKSSKKDKHKSADAIDDSAPSLDASSNSNKPKKSSKKEKKEKPAVDDASETVIVDGGKMEDQSLLGDYDDERDDYHDSIVENSSSPKSATKDRVKGSGILLDSGSDSDEEGGVFIDDNPDDDYNSDHNKNSHRNSKKEKEKRLLTDDFKQRSSKMDKPMSSWSDDEDEQVVAVDVLGKIKAKKDSEKREEGTDDDVKRRSRSKSTDRSSPGSDGIKKRSKKERSDDKPKKAKDSSESEATERTKKWTKDQDTDGEAEETEQTDQPKKVKKNKDAETDVNEAKQIDQTKKTKKIKDTDTEAGETEHTDPPKKEKKGKKTTKDDEAGMSEATKKAKKQKDESTDDNGPGNPDSGHKAMKSSRANSSSPSKNRIPDDDVDPSKSSKKKTKEKRDKREIKARRDSFEEIPEPEPSPRKQSDEVLTDNPPRHSSADVYIWSESPRAPKGGLEQVKAEEVYDWEKSSPKKQPKSPKKSPPKKSNNKLDVPALPSLSPVLANNEAKELVASKMKNLKNKITKLDIGIDSGAAPGGGSVEEIDAVVAYATSIFETFLRDPKQYTDDAIDALLQEFPHSSSIVFELKAPSLHTGADDKVHLYPLAVLCALGASRKTISVCHELHPESIRAIDKRIGTPLHYAVSFGILSAASRAESMIEVIKYLLEEEPVLVESQSNYLCQTVLHQTISSIFSSPKSSDDEHLTALASVTVSLLLEKEPLLATLPDIGNRLPLHLAAMCVVPKGIMQRILKENPGALTLRCKAKGFTPLHYSVEVFGKAMKQCFDDHGGKGDKNETSDTSTVLNMHLEKLQRYAINIQTLLKAGPHAAEIQDHNGNFPLHVFLSSCEGNGSDPDVLGFTSDVFVGVLQTIIAANPEGVDIPDSSEMTPLMVAEKRRASEAVLDELKRS